MDSPIWFDAITSPSFVDGEGTSYSGGPTDYRSIENLGTNIWQDATGFSGDMMERPYADLDSPGISQAYRDYLNNNNITFQGSHVGNDLYSQMFKNGESQGSRFVSSFDDPLFGAAIDAGVMGLTGGAFSPASAAGLGGMWGGALNGATGGLIMGGGQGASPLKSLVGGALGGAVGAGVKGYNPAGMLGVENKVGQGIVNRGIGSAVGSLAQGNSLQDSLKQGATGSLLGGINAAGKAGMDFLSNNFKDIFGGDGLGDLPGTMVSDPMDQSAPVSSYSDEGDKWGDAFSAPMGQQQIQSAGNSSGFGEGLGTLFGNMGSSIGNYALNNAGDLASTLYGFYNNRRQQRALGQQMSSLQGLYGQNSPYAAQLRNKLNAQAAQQGRRSNIAGRETQLQAQLADRAASLAPTLMQLQGQKGMLQNSMGSNMIGMLNKMGGFNGLQNLFQKNPLSNYSMSGNTSDYNTLGMEGHY